MFIVMILSITTLFNILCCLSELEDYKFFNDYFLWCAERRIDASDKNIRVHYMRLDEI